MRKVMPTGPPTVFVAVQALRSYRNALSAMALDQGAINSWIERNASQQERPRNFPNDAAVGVLNHAGHPLYPTSDLTQEQQDWALLMVSAEQGLQEEATWISQQVAQHNATMFMRVFGSDMSWIHEWATDSGININDVPNEYLLNLLIDALRDCEGQNGAGSISHTVYHAPGLPGGDIPR